MSDELSDDLKVPKPTFSERFALAFGKWYVLPCCIVFNTLVAVVHVHLATLQAAQERWVIMWFSLSVAATFLVWVALYIIFAAHDAKIRMDALIEVHKAIGQARSYKYHHEFVDHRTAAAWGTEETA